jgi:hypothetical protein
MTVRVVEFGDTRYEWVDGVWWCGPTDATPQERLLVEEVERQQAGVRALLAQRDELLDWLMEGLDYPFNGPMWTLPRFPESCQRLLAERWHAKDGRDDETVDDYLQSCEEEGGWRLSDATLVAREAALRAELWGDR